ncbi:MAG: hypothetical protein CVU09_11230 [Bacteroidetes bacterium HGW-Bacteroidetes-4]|jgi:hypothetical protein|nr:MAG: hypothetical protein CVU09_11230 [Bacteroidetes bacterium HGW-Bacteroidetes-4]
MQEYTKTDKQIHWLSQIIAKLNRAYLPAKDDDSHTNLSYDPIEKKLCGRWIESSEGQLLPTFNLHTLQFEWKNRSMQALAAVTIFDKSLHQLEKEIAEYPQSIGMDTKEISIPLHFEIPDYHINTIKHEDISQEGLQNWSFLRHVANNACYQLLGYLQIEDEIRIWPHHFDTGVYAQVSKSLGIGFGLAMEDSMVGEPYFYIAGYSNDKEINYSNLITLKHGKWMIQNWKGAVLPISELMGLSIEDTTQYVNNFIETTLKWYIQQSPQTK